MTTFLDLHVLQTVPPSNVNRDDTGSPKTAVFGGVRRARVSSQAWKRAMRVAFRDTIAAQHLGQRTKRIVELLGREIHAQDPDISDEAARQLAETVWKLTKLEVVAPPTKTGAEPKPAEARYLVFLSAAQIRGLAELAVASLRTGEALNGKEVLRRADTSHSVDIALFGRMVAEASDWNVDACAQVAHAISVHAVDNEFDYFTAVDDLAPQDNTGAGMIGTVEFNSSTLYRYATVNVDALHAALGDSGVTQEAVAAFVHAFITSMPTGKQATFANRTLPDAVLVQVREGQPVNLVGAFEEPVSADEGPRSAAAATRLARRSTELDEAFGNAPTASWALAVGTAREPLSGVGQVTDLMGLLDQVRATLATSAP